VPLVAVAVAVFGTFAVGLPITTSLLLVALLGVMAHLGQLVAVRINGETSNQLIEGIAIGMTVGLGFISLLIAIAGGLQSIEGVLLLVALALIVLVLAIRDRKRIALPVETDTVLPWLMAISILSLAIKMWVFTLPFVCALFVLLGVRATRHRIQSHRSRNMLSSAAWGLVIGASLWSNHLARLDSSEGMIFRSADQYFRTSLATTVIKFGLSDHPGAIGYPLRYHWLSEAQMGFLSYFSPGPTLEVVLRFSALGATFAASLAIFLLAREVGLGRAQALFAVVLLTIVSTILFSFGLNVLKTTEMGQLWGTAFFLVGLLFLVRFSRVQTPQLALIVPISVVVTMMVNSTLGLVLAGTAVAMTVVLFLKREARKSWLLLMGFSVGLSVLVLRATLLNSPDEFAFTPTIGFADPFGYALVFGYNGTSIFVQAAAAFALVLVMWFQGGASLGMRWLSAGDRLAHQEQWVLEISVAIGIGLATVVSLGASDQYRFLLPILIISPIAAASLLKRAIDDVRNMSWFRKTMVIGPSVLFGYFLSGYVSKSFGDAEFMLPRLIFVGAMITSPLVVWAILTLDKQMRKESPRHSVRLASVFLAMSFTVGLVHTLQITVQQFDYARELAAPSVTNAGRYECLEFVNKNSDSDSILASTMWRWGEDQFTEKWYIASAVAERRTYLDGPLYVLYNQGDAASWLDKRGDLTNRFAEQPNSDDFKELRSWDVDLFVVDKAWPHAMNWEGFGSVRFNNEACAVFELD
jgi:hypothetical protein